MNIGSKKSTGPLVHLLGLVGVLCVGIAIAGLWGAFAPAAKAPVARVAPPTPVVAAAASQALPAMLLPMIRRLCLSTCRAAMDAALSAAVPW